MGTEEEQQEMAICIQVLQPLIELRKSNVYGVDYLEIQELPTGPLGEEVLTGTINDNPVSLSREQFKYPDGTGGILLDTVTFGINNEGILQG